jgi:hypothetical protein
MELMTTLRIITHLVEAQALCSRVPGKGSEKGVQLLRGIPKSSEILAEHDDDLGAFFLRVSDEL